MSASMLVFLLDSCLLLKASYNSIAVMDRFHATVKL